VAKCLRGAVRKHAPRVTPVGPRTRYLDILVDNNDGPFSWGRSLGVGRAGCGCSIDALMVGHLANSRLGNRTSAAAYG
jgi:hypothetical protein